MSKNMNDWLNKNLEEVELPCNEKKSLIQRYLQNPFSIVWSKLTALIKATQAPSQPEALENNQFEEHELKSIREHYLYTHFTDRVEPSLYYQYLRQF
ncbi:hypothetical protein [Scytonema sp. PRP1]|uniref:hypothetical protein n=1 Tax=Scytonema sp. PRP1 TaxID=3120513 RepID=UPI002FD5D1CF